MAAVFALVIEGAGLIVTVTCCAVPGHEPTDEVGVTVYTTVSTAAPVLVMVLLMVEVDCDVVLSPVVLVLLFAIHVYDEATLLVSGILTALPLQMVEVLALVIAGVGFMVTVTCCAVPGQEPVDEVGVTV